jgi:hypothetical protein
MWNISLNNPVSKWAYARLSDGEKELVSTASYSPLDALRDLVGRCSEFTGYRDSRLLLVTGARRTALDFPPKWARLLA